VISRVSFSLGGLCVLALAMAGCAGTPPTPPEEDPVQIKLKDLDTRLGRIDRVVANQSLLDLANQNDAMRADLRAMHNDIDQLNNKLETSRKEQHDLYADLDRRMRLLEGRGGGGSAAAGSDEAGAAGAGAAGAGAAGSSAGSGADDKAAYQAAFDLLKNSQIDAAIAAFQKFLLSFPDSTLADNAQYWLGEANYVNKAFPAAQAAFQKLVDKFPQSRKVPDALLKIGYCQYELKDFDAARRTLSKVTTQFPDSPSGHLAQQRLDSMAAEKH
jgi:tol-pal system protein YbgF